MTQTSIFDSRIISFASEKILQINFFTVRANFSEKKMEMFKTKNWGNSPQIEEVSGRIALGYSEITNL